jgi:hypothetical protein
MQIGGEGDPHQGQGEQAESRSSRSLEKLRTILTQPREGTVSQLELDPLVTQIDEAHFNTLSPEDKAMVAHAAGFGTPIAFINAHQQLLDAHPEELNKAGDWGIQYLMDRYRDVL